MDANSNANIINYGTLKSSRVPRIVLSFEILGLVPGFDISTTRNYTINNMFGRLIQLLVHKNSKRIYDSMVKIDSTSKKTLLAYMHILH